MDMVFKNDRIKWPEIVDCGLKDIFIVDLLKDFTLHFRKSMVWKRNILSSIGA